MAKEIDLKDKRFERLLVIEKYIEPNRIGNAKWICLCNPEFGGCGKSTIVAGGNLRNSHTRSCGCLALEITKASNTSHGLTSSPEYYTWAAVKRRCTNKKCPDYPNYGGRGITVSDEWRKSFETFYKDMGSRPSKDHSIDRIDNDKGYSKENCRWATDREQSNNKRNSVLYNYNGKMLNVNQIAEIVGINSITLYYRLRTMSLENSLYPVVDRSYTRDGITRPLKEWCRILDISYTTTLHRIQKGMLHDVSISIRLLKKDYQYTVDGLTKTLNEWCVQNSVLFKVMCARLFKGWTFKEALRLIEKEVFEYDGSELTLYEWCCLMDLDQDKTYLRIIRGESLKTIIEEV